VTGCLGYVAEHFFAPQKKGKPCKARKGVRIAVNRATTLLMK
jgi:hypothetical protein